jgi:hypothetical protein
MAAPSLVASWLEDALAIGNADARKEVENDIRDVAVEAYVGGFETVSCHCMGGWLLHTIADELLPILFSPCHDPVP